MDGVERAGVSEERRSHAGGDHAGEDDREGTHARDEERGRRRSAVAHPVEGAEDLRRRPEIVRSEERPPVHDEDEGDGACHRGGQPPEPSREAFERE